jgi:hypothetical protein
MVKATKTKKKTGRPPGDPDDVRSERTTMRMHPNLLHELNVGAREAGKNRSLFVEWVLISWINNRLLSRGERPLDAIGKYVDDTELQRLESMAANQYAQRTFEYGGPPGLQPSPLPGGLPRWAPPATPKPPRKK